MVRPCIIDDRVVSDLCVMIAPFMLDIHQVVSCAVGCQVIREAPICI